MDVLAKMNKGQERVQFALVFDGAGKAVKAHAALLAVGVAFPAMVAQIAASDTDLRACHFENCAIVERPLLSVVYFREQRGAAKQAAHEQVERKLARGLIPVQNACGCDELQHQARAILGLRFGNEIAEVLGGEFAAQDFGVIGVNFALVEIVGDALELITSQAASNAGAAQLVKGINEVRQKFDALAEEGHLKGERFAGVNQFPLGERRENDKRMRQVGGRDVGVNAAVLRRLKNIGVCALIAELAVLAALSGWQDAADFFHDVPKPAAQGRAFVCGELDGLLRGEVEGEGGEGEGWGCCSCSGRGGLGDLVDHDLAPFFVWFLFKSLDLVLFCYSICVSY